MPETELLPCPFCGGKADIEDLGRLVYCKECGTEGPFCGYPDKARAAWNRRATPAPDAPSWERIRITVRDMYRALYDGPEDHDCINAWTDTFLALLTPAATVRAAVLAEREVLIAAIERERGQYQSDSFASLAVRGVLTNVADAIRNRPDPAGEEKSRGETPHSDSGSRAYGSEISRRIHDGEDGNE